MTEQSEDARHDDEAEGYAGAATVAIAEREYPVQVSVTGHFEPISGSYTWYGRIRELPEVPAGDVVLRIPDGEAQVALTERDLWGNQLFRGVGAPPYSAFDVSALD